MYARAVDDAEANLRTLRHEIRGDLALAAIALGLAVAASQARPALALPLFVGGLVVGALGARAAWRRSELVERLAGEGDAYVISEIRDYATRQTTAERRQTFAALVRTHLPRPGFPTDARVAAVADELEALAAELEDDTLELDPTAAVAGLRLLTEVEQSPLLNRALPAEELRACVRRIRAGFVPRGPAA